MKIQILGQSLQVVAISLAFPRNNQGMWVGGKDMQRVQEEGNDAHTHEPLLEHSRDSLMEKQTETQSQGGEDVYWDIPRGFSSLLQVCDALLCRNSKLAQHCPCLNPLNQDLTPSLREKLFDKPTQDSSFLCTPSSSPINWIMILYFSLYSISLLPSLPTHPSFPFFFY